MNIYSMDEYDLRDAILGSRVVAVDEVGKTITLEDGTELVFEDTHECCAWFSAELERGNLTDNAVTAVQVVETGDPNDWEVQYTIHILAADKRIASVHIEGDEGTGYYCHSIDLVINKKEIA